MLRLNGQYVARIWINLRCEFSRDVSRFYRCIYVGVHLLRVGSLVFVCIYKITRKRWKKKSLTPPVKINIYIHISSLELYENSREEKYNNFTYFHDFIKCRYMYSYDSWAYVVSSQIQFFVSNVYMKFNALTAGYRKIFRSIHPFFRARLDFTDENSDLSIAPFNDTIVFTNIVT